MKRYIKSENSIALSSEFIESTTSLAKKLENQFKFWTGITFSINPDSIKFYAYDENMNDNPSFSLTAKYLDIIDGYDAPIFEYLDSSTPFLRKLLSYNDLQLNPDSNIDIVNSSNINDWHNNLILSYIDTDNELEDVYGYTAEEFNKEKIYVENQIIDTLYEHNDSIIDFIGNYVVFDVGWED